jgi:hypothetical protein
MLIALVLAQIAMIVGTAVWLYARGGLDAY